MALTNTTRKILSSLQTTEESLSAQIPRSAFSVEVNKLTNLCEDLRDYPVQATRDVPPRGASNFLCIRRPSLPLLRHSSQWFRRRNDASSEHVWRLPRTQGSRIGGDERTADKTRTFRFVFPSAAFVIACLGRQQDADAPTSLRAQDEPSER